MEKGTDDQRTEYLAERYTKQKAIWNKARIAFNNIAKYVPFFASVLVKTHRGGQFIMKQRICNISLVFLIFIMCLSSCQKQLNERSSNPPPSSGDGWRDVYFRETHNLLTSLPVVFYDVTVNKLFPEVYQLSPSEKCLLLECKIEHNFYQSPAVDFKSNWTVPNDFIYLWVNVTKYDANTISSLRDLFETVDSVIIYGHQIEPYIAQNSTLCRQLENELGESVDYFNFDGASYLKLSPCIMIYELEEWPILPIVDGIFTADCLTSILSEDNMAFSFELENPDGLQYFKHGDDLDTVYDALKKFVIEYFQ